MALTKVNRGGLNTGVTDSSDATAITIDSSERVGIGTSPSHPLHILTSTDGSGLSGDDTWAAVIRNAEATGYLVRGSSQCQSLVENYNFSIKLYKLRGISRAKRGRLCTAR